MNDSSQRWDQTPSPPAKTQPSIPKTFIFYSWWESNMCALILLKRVFVSASVGLHLTERWGGKVGANFKSSESIITPLHGSTEGRTKPSILTRADHGQDTEPWRGHQSCSEQGGQACVYVEVGPAWSPFVLLIFPFTGVKFARVNLLWGWKGC